MRIALFQTFGGRLSSRLRTIINEPPAGAICFSHTVRTADGPVRALPVRHAHHRVTAARGVIAPVDGGCGTHAATRLRTFPLTGIPRWSRRRVRRYCRFPVSRCTRVFPRGRGSLIGGGSDSGRTPRFPPARLLVAHKFHHGFSVGTARGRGRHAAVTGDSHRRLSRAQRRRAPRLEHAVPTRRGTEADDRRSHGTVNDALSEHDDNGHDGGNSEVAFVCADERIFHACRGTPIRYSSGEIASISASDHFDCLSKIARLSGPVLSAGLGWSLNSPVD